MKKIFVLALALIMCILASYAGGDTASAATYPKLNIRMSLAGSNKGADADAAQYFAKLVKEASGGNITVTAYPDSQLVGGNMPKNGEMLVAGGLFPMAIFSGSVLGAIDERLMTHMLPFMFDNYAAASKMQDTTGNAYYAKLLDAKGVLLINGLHNGLRQLSNSKVDVSEPAHLKGLKIRVPSGEVQIKSLQALGGDPIAMEWTEVFTSLQQKVLDGQENGYMTINSGNIHEVNKHMTEWNWCYDGYWFVANKRDWAKFDDATKALLLEKANEASIWGRKNIEETEIGLKKRFKEKDGVTITELTPEQRAKFVELVRPVHEYFIKKYGPEVCAAWGLK